MAAGAAGPATRASRSAIIATLPRSGSWLLAEGMEDSGRCGIPREYFRPDYEAIYRREWEVPPGVPHAGYVRAVVRAGTTPDGTFGVKLHWGQFARLITLCRAGLERTEAADSDVMQAVFPNPRYVYLTRRNKARQAISLYRAMLLDTWWTFDDAGVREAERAAARITPDFDDIAGLEAGLIRDELHWMAFFGSSRVRPLLLTFEALVAGYRDAVLQVIAHVNRHECAGVTVPPPRLRAQTDPTSDMWLADYLAHSSQERLRAARAAYRARARAFAAENRP